MHIKRKKLFSLIFSLALPALCIVASDEGPAGAGSGLSALPHPISLPLTSLENISKFEDIILEAIQALLPSLHLKYSPERIIAIEDILADIKTLYENKYKRIPITSESPLLQHLHSTIQEASFLFYYARCKKVIVEQEDITPGLFDCFLREVINFLRDKRDYEDIKRVPLLSLALKLTQKSQEYLHAEEYYYLKTSPESIAADPSLKPLLTSARKYAQALHAFAADASNMLSTFYSKHSDPAPYMPETSQDYAPPISFSDPTRENPIIESIRTQITNYWREKSASYDTLHARTLMNTTQRYLSTITAPLFSSELCEEQKNLLAHSQNYTECFQKLSQAKRKMLNLISGKFEYTDEQAVHIIHSLIYGLATDLIYSQLQHYETNPDIRKHIRETLSICPPDSPTPWHQDILRPSELPHFKIIEETDINNIMNMVRRWTFTSIILFIRELVEKKEIAPEDGSMIDEYLINILMPLDTYTFDEEQKNAILHDTKRAHQLRRLSITRRAIKEKKPGYATGLLYALFHQTMTQKILDLLDAEQMSIHMRLQLKKLPCFALEKAPKSKKNRKGQRK